MNDAAVSGSRSYVVMDGGTVNVTGNSYFNDDADVDSEAYFTLNAGTFNGGGIIDVSGAAGYAILTDGDYTVLIPEPATLVLLGLGGIGMIRRRKR